MQCVHCRTTYHNSCMGLDKFAYLGGWMECAGCTLMQAKVNASVDDFTPVAEAAHRLVLLRSQQLADSTNSTYASGIHRFMDFGINVAKADLAQILPPKQEDQIPQKLVELFISWASKKYQYSTIQTTLNALKAWHTSKQAGTDTVANPAITSLMTAVKNEQGPAGLPKGKEGMSKALLRIVLALMVEKSRADARFAPLYTRDYAWMVLGYFGFLRRSELIELTMQDVQFQHDYVMLHIRKSKTDRLGKGAQVAINATSSDGIRILDRVRAYSKLREAQGASPDSPFLVQWDLDKYQLGSSKLTNGQALAQRLKLYLQQLQERHPNLTLNPNSYGMHSLRRGGVIAAWGAGVELEKIKAHGRWRSDAVRVYMQASLPIKLSVTQAM